MAPRGTRYNACAFEVVDIGDGVVDELLTYSDSSTTCEIVFLEISGLPWQRFFLEFGEGWWEEYSDADIFFGYEDVQLKDHGQLFGVTGQRVRGARCVADPSGHAACIVLDLERGQLELRVIPAQVTDPDTEFVYMPR